MGIHLNDEELLALTGLPDIHIRLYIFGIRRYMDYTNGVVGVKRRISYQSLSEVLYIEPIRGVKTPQKTKSFTIASCCKKFRTCRFNFNKKSQVTACFRMFCLLNRIDLSKSRPTQSRHSQQSQTITLK